MHLFIFHLLNPLKKNVGKMLVEIGLEESMAIEGYWNHVVNNPEGHHWPICMEPPCRCYGVLDVRYVTSQEKALQSAFD